MAVFKCKICGGTLEININQSVATCEYCGTKQTLPKLDDERKANLYDRANHFRRNNDFDKAMSIYEQILNEDNTDAESYWSILLCRYGIEYVEDPATHKRVPTVNRAQYTSVFDDEDYKSALQYADGFQREIYQSEAAAINEIQKGILAISQKEEPFDVFICYKETDNSGRRTKDSVLATELYHELTKEGYKVFFSRITLEDKLGVAYEPYIFAALNSAKVMVVLGTRPEHFNAVWVKNEWSRYLALIKNGAKKTLIPAYRDMDPYDLPEEFSHLQAQDMSKLGFMQDLTRGIKKIIETDDKPTFKETIVQANSTINIAPLLKRAFMFLEDGDFERADDFCEQVLNQDPENAEAYLGKLMAELGVRRQQELADCAEPFDDNKNYQKAVRFGDGSFSAIMKGYNSSIKERNARKAEEARKESLYLKAIDNYNSADVLRIQDAINAFSSLNGYEDSNEYIRLCQSRIAQIHLHEEKYRQEQERLAKEKIIAEERKAEISKRRNKKIKLVSAIGSAVFVVLTIILTIFIFIPNSNYNKALAYAEKYDYQNAILYFEKNIDYKDCKEKIKECQNNLNKIRNKQKQHFRVLSAGYSVSAAIKTNGTVLSTNNTTTAWSDVVSIDCHDNVIAAVLKNGSVVTNGKNDVSQWTNIVSVAVGANWIFGLKDDGTVVVKGDYIDVSDWFGIVQLDADEFHVVGLRFDGTVVSSKGYQGADNVDDWEDIISIAAGRYHTVGLKSDGTVVSVGSNEKKQCFPVYGWSDIVKISAHNYQTVGLRSDGTVVATGMNTQGQCNVNELTNVVDIAAGSFHTIATIKDGTVIVVGTGTMGSTDVDGWNSIKLS